MGQAKTVGRMSEKSGQHDKLVATLREQIAAKDAEAASVTGQLQGVQALLKKLKGQNKKTKNALLGIAREKTAHKSLARKIAKARDTLAQLRGELGKSTAAAEARYKAKARKLMLKRVDLMVQATQLTRAFPASAVKFAACSLQQSAVNAQKTQLQQRKDKASRLCKQSRADYNRLMEQQQRLKEQVAAAFDRAKAVTDPSIQEQPKLKDAVRKRRDDPDVDGAQAEIAEKKQQASMIMENKQAVVTYERNVKELKDVKAQLAHSSKAQSKNVKKMTQLRDAWLPPVTAMADKINNKFMAYFKEIHEHGYQCAGEVELTGEPCAAAAGTGDAAAAAAAEDGGAGDAAADKDFSTYGMDIKVKFRKDQELETLTGEVQSGGERALSTFLYLLAMQEMTNCPFRVVDEINQGMDPTKERLAFHRLLDSTCRAKLPQYFLITPKLLQDLEFTEDVTVLVIFNGPWAPPQDKWDIPKFCKRRRSFQSGARKKAKK